MSQIEAQVAGHYGDDGLLNRILAALEASGIDIKQLKADDLAPIEEFHTGGRVATMQVVEQLSLDAGQKVLDIGCGIGGAARYISKQTGCHVCGIDLTPEYILIADILSELTGMKESTSFKVASALDMPYKDQSFDAALTLHVAMNIHDREALYAEIARVLKPGSHFCLFDIMRTGEGDLSYPVPWSMKEETSHLTTTTEMIKLLEGAGFSLVEVADKRDFALAFFKQSMEKMKQVKSPLGVHLIMGETAPQKLKNVKLNIENGLISPVQMLAVRN